MKYGIRNIGFFGGCIGGFIALFTAISCMRTTEDLFDQTAALRINESVKTAKEELVTANNGWVMNYFPEESQSGATYLVKFGVNGIARMGTKNDYVPTYSEEEGYWDVLAENGPVLSFNTNIPIFHIYSDPSSGLGYGSGTGLGGDYEFTVMNVTTDYITLKGKKRGIIINLTRLAEGQNWEDYFTILDEMNERMFNPCITSLKLTVNDTVFSLSDSYSHIFTLLQEGKDALLDSEYVPFMVTEKGILFSKAHSAAGVNVREFALADDGSKLVCTDKNEETGETVNAIIECEKDIPDFYFDTMEQGFRWTMLSGDNNMSPAVAEVFATIEQAFAKVNTTIGQISLLYSTKNNFYSVYIENNKKAGGYLYFDQTPMESGVTYNFRQQYDSNGRSFYNNYNGVSALMGLLSDSFRLERISSALNPTVVKLTSVSDSSIWFIVKASNN